MRREDEGVVGGVTRDWREENVLGYCFIVERQRIPLLICRRTHRPRVYLLFSGMRGGCLGYEQGAMEGGSPRSAEGFSAMVGMGWKERGRVT